MLIWGARLPQPVSITLLFSYTIVRLCAKLTSLQAIFRLDRCARQGIDQPKQFYIVTEQCSKVNSSINKVLLCSVGSPVRRCFYYPAHSELATPTRNLEFLTGYRLQCLVTIVTTL